MSLTVAPVDSGSRGSGPARSTDAVQIGKNQSDERDMRGARQNDDLPDGR